MRATDPALARRVPSLGLALVLLLTAMILPLVPATADPAGTAADDFQSGDFNGSTGSLPWTGPWNEQGESDGAGAGAIQVSNEPNCPTDPCLLLGRASFADTSVDRQVDLSAYASATLAFDYRVHAHNPGAGQAYLSISSNGGGPWAPLDSWDLDTTSGTQSASYDISAHLASNTSIKFEVVGNTDDSHMNVDNLVITADDSWYLKGPDIPSSALGGTPTQTALPNYDPGRDGEIGLLLTASSDGLEAEIDPTKHQWWLAPARSQELDGPVTLTLWSALKDFATGLRGIVDAGLYDCLPTGAECNLLATAQLDLADWSGGTAGWVERELDFGSVSATLGATRSLAVKVVVDQNSDDDMWFAYDTVAYQSRLNVTLAAPPPPDPGVIVISEFSHRNDDFIELYNAGSSSVDIDDFVLRLDGPGTSHITITQGGGPIILPPGGHYLLAQAGSGLAGAADQTFGFALPSDLGMRLRDASSTLLDAVGIGSSSWFESNALPSMPAGTAQSYERLNGVSLGNCIDTDDNRSDFVHVWGYATPEGTSNPAVPCGMPLPADHVVISEFRPEGPAGQADEFVELFNPTATPVDISAWVLHITQPGLFRDYHVVPGGTVLDPDEHYLLSDTDGPTPNDAQPYDIPTDYASGWGDVVLKDNVGTVIDVLGYGPTSNGQMYESVALPAYDGGSDDRSFTRRDGGYTDIDKNIYDFVYSFDATPTPGNPGPNRAPAFDQDLGDRTDAEGDLIDIDAPATDPDSGDNLTYTATGLPEGVVIDPNSGTISGAPSPNASGTHFVALTVTDDGTPTLEDADTFSWTVIPGEVTYLIANNGGGNGGDDLLTVVDRSDANPVTNEVNIGTGTGTTGIEAAALQPGSNTLFAVDRDQLGTIDVTSGVFMPRPSIAGAGSGAVGLIALDNIEGLAFDPFSGELFATHRRGFGEEDLLFKINPATGAHIPGAFGGDDYVLVQNQGPYWHAADIAFDPTDGQLYLVHWTILNQWSLATIDSATGSTATIGPAPANLVSLAFDETGRLYSSTEDGLETLYELNKTNAAQVSAIIIDNADDYEAMAIAFPVDPNQAPVFSQNLTNRSDAEGATISVSAAATDPDAGDNLKYSAVGLPPGLAIDASSGLISGTIGFVGTGTYSTEITVTDDGIPNLSALDTFTWTISELNQPPAFSQDLLDRSDAEGDAISLAAAATDPDLGDNLTYGATGLPAGLTIDTASGLISGTIDFSANAASPYAVTVTVTDDGVPNASATPDTFTWTVADTNLPPTIVNPGAQTTPELAPFTLGLAASDPDGSTPSFNDGGTLPGWATLTDNGDGTAAISGTPGGGASGTTTVTISVSDGGTPNLTDSAVFDLTVTNTNLPPTIVNPGNQTIGEGSTMNLPLTGSDPDGTTVSFSDSGSLPGWATLTDNGDNTATVTGTPGYSDAGTTTVTVTVTDGSLTDDAVFDIIVTNTNRTPTADPIADQTVAENTPFTLLVTGSDPDGPPPSLTATALPAWATITDHGDGTATIAGTPGFDDAGTATVTVNAFDGSLLATASFDLTVTNTNRAPIANAVANASVAEGTALVPIVVTATDPDGTLPSLAATGLPGWATFVDNGDGTATITGTPGYSDAAITTITVNVEDGGVPNLADSTSFDLTVTNTNRPPVMDPVADQTVAEGTPFTHTVTASDPDGTIPSLSDAGLPSWASLVDNGDGTATLAGTPGPGDAATTTVTVTASDGPLTHDAVFDLTVTDVNRPPVFDTDLPDRGDAEGAVISLPAAATDPDLDNITYAAAGLPPGLAMDPGTGLISGTVATIAEAGSPYAVTLTATDSGTPNLSATDTFTWTITNTNQSPVFSQDLADRVDAEGAVISLSAGATDPDLDVLSYSGVGLPPGLAISPTTGVVSGTISLSSVGSYDVTITVTDSGSPVLTATDTFTWVVTNTNQPPRLAPIGDQLGPEETELTFTAEATDPDGDGVEFSLAGAPAGAAIDTTTGLFTWTPGEVDGVGSHTVTVIATDDGSPQLTDSQVVTITVTETNLPPTIETIDDQTSNEGSSVSLAVVAADPDLPTNYLSFSATGLPPGLAINGSNGLISGTVATDTVGVYAVTIAVTDNAEPPYLATTTFKWTITDTNKAPRLGRVSDQFGDEQTTISFTATATDEDGDNLTYSLTSGPAGARIGANSGVFTWTPGELDGPGTFSVVVLVTDDGTPALGDTQVVSITVGEVNLPPTIDPIEDQQGNAGDEVELAISVTDPDLPANESTLSATGLPPGLFLNPATGAIGGTLQASEEALFTVELTVTDHGIPQLSATTSFMWTVSPAPDEPDPAAPPTIGEIGNQYTDEGSTVNLTVPATSTGTLSYKATGLPPGLTINPRTGSITGTVGTDAIGTHWVVVTVTDDATPAQLAHSAFTWTVTDVAAAEDKDDLVQALDQFTAEAATTVEPGQDDEPVRRSLVVMGSAAAATTESLRWPFALLAALLVGFATVGRVGLYPLLWRGDRQTGTITLYDPELLFGLIEPDGGGEAVHVHANAFPRRMRPLLQIGMRVRYRVLASDNRSSAWGATADE